MAARDAAVAELMRCHAAEESMEQQEALPGELECSCSAASFAADKADAALCKRRERSHPSSRCPIAIAEFNRSERRCRWRERRSGEADYVRDMCRELKAPDPAYKKYALTHPEGVTVSSLADYLESGLLRNRKRQLCRHAVSAAVCQHPTCPGNRFYVVPDAAVISYIRSFEAEGERQQRFDKAFRQAFRRVSCDLAYLRKDKCHICGAHSC